jgi:uncharacterized protein YbcC (UPF0753/DUF2309 family)
MYNEHDIIHHLKHFLPAQAPLKDFIHHNTLHAFQDKSFHFALKDAKETLGYKTYLSLNEYRKRFRQGQISEQVIDKIITEKYSDKNISYWKSKMFNSTINEGVDPRLGIIRTKWTTAYNLEIDDFVHPLLFRILCSYLDQGISIWDFPTENRSFIENIKHLESNTFASFFKTKEAKNKLFEDGNSIEKMLQIIVGDEAYFQPYLIDQQFAHQGWSGMVSAIEDNPSTLLVAKKISLKDIIFFELLLEYDTIIDRLGKEWKPIAASLDNSEKEVINSKTSYKLSELDEILILFQESFEWSYYDTVLNALSSQFIKENIDEKSFQALFCIDDRECSIRRWIEKTDSSCETYGTPGFFGVEFYFKPQGGKFLTKVCPAPITPKHVIQEIGVRKKLEKDIHFSKHSHSFIFGWFITQSIGFWSAFKLFINIFKPQMNPATASSLKHMDKLSKLTIENKNESKMEDGLQVGFTIDEMTLRTENVLRSIGLTSNFAPIVYVVGHGASSNNNPHYAAYDCGACSGRAGSVNARALSYMANHPVVRQRLAEKGIEIPDNTQFIGAIRDTTRDEIVFFDENSLSKENKILHQENCDTFKTALDLNAKERSRRFESIKTQKNAAKIHEKIMIRSVSLFEPRPELNHATNALCIVGRRDLSKKVFLDRRAFLNSYDYAQDPEGKYLLGILNAAAPVCGGINLEYYFSRVDNQKLGAGSKLPHNVMGLIGVANGIDGDLRPGLPSQMIEVHDPVRLLMIVEHFPEIVLKTIQTNPVTYEWFENEWIHLVVFHPEEMQFYRFEKGSFISYQPLPFEVKSIDNVESIIESQTENIPVFHLN